MSTSLEDWHFYRQQLHEYLDMRGVIVFMMNLKRGERI